MSPDLRLQGELFRRMLRIRLFEERLLVEFSRGKLAGTTHAYIGQEANAVGVLMVAGPACVAFSSHRCHGHFLAHGGDMRALVAELMGRSTGVCGGKGGSQHLCADGFYSNGVQGGIVPCAAGIALAEKVRKTGKLVIVFLGDGTFGEGVVYETLNIASLWKLPILFAVENNRYAQTTPISKAFAGSFTTRFEGFGIKSFEAETSDVLEVCELSHKVITSIHKTSEPAAIILHTYRFCAHSKGDDTRDPKEVEACRKYDPLEIHGRRLSVEERERIRLECAAEIDEAFRLAERDPFPTELGPTFACR